MDLAVAHLGAGLYRDRLEKPSKVTQTQTESRDGLKFVCQTQGRKDDQEFMKNRISSKKKNLRYHLGNR